MFNIKNVDANQSNETSDDKVLTSLSLPSVLDWSRKWRRSGNPDVQLSRSSATVQPTEESNGQQRHATEAKLLEAMCFQCRLLFRPEKVNWRGSKEINNEFYFCLCSWFFPFFSLHVTSIIRYVESILQSTDIWRFGRFFVFPTNEKMNAMMLILNEKHVD